MKLLFALALLCVCLVRGVAATCDPGFYGASCELCPADSWCSGGVLTACAAGYGAPPGSDSADDCSCALLVDGSETIFWNVPESMRINHPIAPGTTMLHMEPPWTPGPDVSLPRIIMNFDPPVRYAGYKIQGYNGMYVNYLRPHLWNIGASRWEIAHHYPHTDAVLEYPRSGYYTNKVVFVFFTWVGEPYARIGIFVEAACSACPSGMCCDGSAVANAHSTCVGPAYGACGTCQCDAGYYGVAGVDCAPCPSGSYCPHSTADELTSCGAAGYFSSPPLSTNVSACVDLCLPNGVFDGATGCLCEPGFYESGYTCVNCAAGAYCPGGNSTAIACAENSSSPVGSALPTDCVCESPRIPSHGDGVLSCILCDAGSYFASAREPPACVPCVNGTVAASGTECLCDAGFYWDDSGCVACPANSFSGAGSVGVAACTCVAGYYDGV